MNGIIMYKLYRVEIIKDIPMLSLLKKIPARNIIEAEDLFNPEMIIGFEYLIIIAK